MAEQKAKRRGHRSPRRRAGDSIATEVKRPAKWDNAVSAAYLRLLGATQEDAAEQVGVVARTVRAWEGSPWWPEAEFEARQRWLKGGDSLARRGLYRGLRSQDDAIASTNARWWAERRMPEFAPPKLRHEHTGEDGGPIEVDLGALREDIARRLAPRSK